MRLPLVAVVTALALGGLASPAAATDWTGPEVVDLLNFQRAANGIPADVVHDPALSTGCAEHMAYLKLNGRFQQEQDPAEPGATPAGAQAGMTSVLTSGSATFAPDGSNAFERAPLHLMQTLSPWIARSGGSGGCLVTLAEPFRTFDAPQAFTYPGNGGVAPASEVARESPFVPGDFVGLPQGTTTGPHLYFFAVGPGEDAHALSRGAFTAVSLTGPGGVKVPVKTVDDTTFAQIGGQLRHIGDLLAPGGIIIPVAPLEPGAVYTASATFRPNGGNGTPDAPISRTWSFTAGVDAPKPPLPARHAPEVVATPTPAPTPGAAIPKTIPLPPPCCFPKPGEFASDPFRLTALRLTKRRVVVAGTADASLTIVIAQKVRRQSSRTRYTVWVPRRRLTVRTVGTTAIGRTLKVLPKGQYRVSVTRTKSEPSFAFQKVIAIK